MARNRPRIKPRIHEWLAGEGQRAAGVAVRGRGGVVRVDGVRAG